jgi:hypothetical protein
VVVYIVCIGAYYFSVINMNGNVKDREESKKHNFNTLCFILLFISYLVFTDVSSKVLDFFAHKWIRIHDIYDDDTTVFGEVFPSECEEDELDGSYFSFVGKFPATDRCRRATLMCVLRADHSTRCDDNTYKLWMPYALIMVLIYPIGVPLGYFVLLFRHRNDIDPYLPEFRTEKIVEEFKKEWKKENQDGKEKNPENIKGSEKLEDEGVKAEKGRNSEGIEESQKEREKGKQEGKQKDLGGSKEEFVEPAAKEPTNKTHWLSHIRKCGKTEEIADQAAEAEEEKFTEAESLRKSQGKRPTGSHWNGRKARMRNAATGPEAVQEAKLMRAANPDILKIQFLFDSCKCSYSF